MSAVLPNEAEEARASKSWGQATRGAQASPTVHPVNDDDDDDDFSSKLGAANNENMSETHTLKCSRARALPLSRASKLCLLLIVLSYPTGKFVCTRRARSLAAGWLVLTAGGSPGSANSAGGDLDAFC